MKVTVTDAVEHTRCANCGCAVWVIDTDGEGNYWLLCLDNSNKGCVNTTPIPSDMEVVDD